MTDQAFRLTWISGSPVIVSCVHVWVVACDLCTARCILYSPYLLTATNPSRPQNLKGIKARHLGPSIGWKENKSSPPHPHWFQSVQHKKNHGPVYFLSCKCFNSTILPALCTSSFALYTILPKHLQYKLYNFQNRCNWQTIFIQKKNYEKSKRVL